MRASTLSLAAFALLAFASEARANVCAASYHADGVKAPTHWKNIGEVTGPKMGAHCLTMAKNDLGNKNVSDLRVTKEAVCAAGGTIEVSIHTRLDVKEKRGTPDAVVKAALGVDCPKKKDAPAKKAAEAP